jgi:predicted metal-dependent hydrolase
VETETVSTLTIEGVTLTVVLRRKRVRNVNARLAGSTLRVSAPVGLSQRRVERAVDELARRLVRRVRARRINVASDLLVRARRIAARFPAPPAVGELLFSTRQRARWGSYSPATGTIRLHAALKEMPAWVLDAVIAHELTHVVHRDHSAAFWALLRDVCPDADRARAFLAGVSWLARRWDRLPPGERAQLVQADGEP